jgi:hypothetical protein
MTSFQEYFWVCACYEEPSEYGTEKQWKGKCFRRANTRGKFQVNVFPRQHRLHPTTVCQNPMQLNAVLCRERHTSLQTFQ